MINPQVHLDSLRRKSLTYSVVGVVAGFVTAVMLLAALAVPTLASGGAAYVVGALLGRILIVGVPLIISIVCFRARGRARSDRAKVQASIEREQSA